MAHFAKINSEKKVLTVLTFNDADMIDGKGQVDEATGQQYLEKHNNWPANQWIQTSYNTRNNTHILGGTPFRGNYAGIVTTYGTKKLEHGLSIHNLITLTL